MLLSGCSRATEMNATVRYKPGTTLAEIKDLPLEEEEVDELRLLLPLIADDPDFYLGLGRVSIRNPSHRDWIGVGLILTSPDLEHEVEPYVGVGRTDTLGDIAQMFSRAHVEFRYVLDKIRAGQTIEVQLMSFTPAVTASRMAKDRLDIFGTRLRGELQALQTQLVKDILAARATLRVVVGIRTDASGKGIFLTGNVVGSTNPLWLPIDPSSYAE